MLFSCGHMQSATAHKSTEFVPPQDVVADNYAAIPVTNHGQYVRRVSYNSYSVSACNSCRPNNDSSQPQLVLRAQR
jgi:hypothetical protein